MMIKKIFVILIVMVVVINLIPSWHNSYEAGRLEGYNQGSIDGMDYTKMCLAQNMTPDDISVDSYAYFKVKKKWNFYHQMWEVQPPEPNMWDYISMIQEGVNMLFMLCCIGFGAYWFEERLEKRK